MSARASANGRLDETHAEDGPAESKAAGGATSYPFAAIVGQDEMKQSLLLCVVDPRIAGVMVMGHRGTGKSTTVRALADVLPEITVVENDPYNRDKHELEEPHPKVRSHRIPVPVVDLPLGATEDRVCGTIDLEAALRFGQKRFEPGLIARANRGFLYIDEVNLLDDHLVDVLLDVAASGSNVVEREGISIRHPARFVLVGSGNPEEGDLRPQLLDRFGLSVRITTILDVAARIEIVKRRRAFDLDPAGFAAQWEPEQHALRARVARARKLLPRVELPDPILERIARLCAALQLDGHRGELTLARAACAAAALAGRKAATFEDVHAVALMSLRHRQRRDPLATVDSDERVERELAALAG